MKRALVFSLVVALLVSSAALAVQKDFAGMLGEVSIGVDVPGNWEAVKENTANTADDTQVPCVKLTDKSDVNRWFRVFLAYTQDAAGEALTLRQVGNNMLVAYGTRNSRRVDDGQNDGYYSFEFFVDAVAYRYVFIDNTYDSRIKAGYYLTYLYSYDTLEPTEVNAIISSITIDGKGGGSTSTGGGTSGQTGGNTGTGGGTGTGGVGSSSGGGGCNSGLFALCAMLSAIPFFKKR